MQKNDSSICSACARMQTLHSKAYLLFRSKNTTYLKEHLWTLYKDTQKSIWQLNCFSWGYLWFCIPFFYLIKDVFLSIARWSELHPLSPHSLCNWLKDFHREYRFPPNGVPWKTLTFNMTETHGNTEPWLIGFYRDPLDPIWAYHNPPTKSWVGWSSSLIYNK